MRIIGVTGTLGAGKGTIVEYLIQLKGFTHYSVRQYLIEKIKERKLTVNRDNMAKVANDLRATNSPSFIIEELYKKALEGGNNAVIESIRTPGEIDFLRHQANFLLISVDADPGVRFERITKRKSETDNVDFDTFLANENREMQTTDPNKQNLKRCIQMADIKLLNSGSIEELHKQLESRLDKI